MPCWEPAPELAYFEEQIGFEQQVDLGADFVESAALAGRTEKAKA